MTTFPPQRENPRQVEKLAGLPCNKFADDLFLLLTRRKAARIIACHHELLRATRNDAPGFLKIAFTARSQNLPMPHSDDKTDPQSSGSPKPIRVKRDPR